MKPFFRNVLFGLGFAVTAVVAEAFELVHIDYGRNFFFVFNGGSGDGVREGMTACVDDAGGWELFCGKVVRVKTTVAAVEAPDQFEAYFENGMTIRVMELGAPAGHKRVDDDGAVANTDDEAPDNGLVTRPSTWLTSYVATPILPYHVTFPDFSIDGRMSGTGSLWQSGPITNRSLLGASFGRRMQWSRHVDHQIDFTWRYVAPTEKDIDYDPNSGNVYADEKSKLTDLSLSWDFLSPSTNTGITPGWIAGVAGQYVSYAYTSSIVDTDSGSQSGDLASSSARLLGVMARLGARLEMLWGDETPSRSPSTSISQHGSAGIAVTGLVPLYAKTTWTHGTHNMPLDAVQRDESQTELEDTASFKRSQFGVESSFYMNWMF